MRPPVMSGGFTRSIISSSSSCSSAESTSLRVERRCCASTTRHGESCSGLISEVPAHRVQILDDIDESLHGANAIGGNASDMLVLCVEPFTGLCIVSAYKGVERAIQTKEEQCELAFFS